MSLRSYQLAIERFAKYPTTSAVQYCTLGALGEAGEIANKVKKILRDDAGIITEERREDLISEAGDVLWYLARLATHANFDFGSHVPEATDAVNIFESSIELCDCVNTLSSSQDRWDFTDALDALTTMAWLLGTDLEGLAEANIEKLDSRANRGTIGGSGDAR
jgi:NTP pyrophosphatase (non-canonical NTP hydrolase)